MNEINRNEVIKNFLKAIIIEQDDLFDRSIASLLHDLAKLDEKIRSTRYDNISHQNQIYQHCLLQEFESRQNESIQAIVHAIHIAHLILWFRKENGHIRNISTAGMKLLYNSVINYPIESPCTHEVRGLWQSHSPLYKSPLYWNALHDLRAEICFVAQFHLQITSDSELQIMQSSYYFRQTFSF